MSSSIKVQGLHHAAYRCRDSEETRKFYEDFLGLPLVETLLIELTKSDRKAKVLHTFYEMQDGSYMAFFEEPDATFDFKNQRDFDLHIALEVDEPTLFHYLQKARDYNFEVRGPSDHHFIESIYIRDPNGYVIELTRRVEGKIMETESARSKLDKWTREKELSKMEQEEEKKE